MSATRESRQLRSPVRLSYVGIPRSLRWGYSYGGLCLLAAGVGLATFRERCVGFVCFAAVLGVCYARFVGARVRVSVWPRASGDGYDVATRVWGFVSRYVVSHVPVLDSKEVGFSDFPKELNAKQWALCLRCGSLDIALPSLHAPVGFEDARDRLEPFRRALRELGAGDAEEATSEGDGDWEFPDLEGRIDGLRWARGRGSVVALRHGVTQPMNPVLLAATRLFACIFATIALATLLPSELGIAHRVWVAMGATLCALFALAPGRYSVRLRLDASAGRERAQVLVEYLVLGLVVYAKRVPLGDGLRLLYVKSTTEDSEGSSTGVDAYLTTEAGVRHHLTGGDEEDFAQREVLDSFGASIATQRLVDAALEPAPELAQRIDYAEPARVSVVPGVGALSRFNALGVLMAALALLVGVGSLTRELLDLRNAHAWIETKYYPDEIQGPKHSELVARPLIDPRVVLEPHPPGSGVANMAPCWVIDDPHGHDIARYTLPDEPPTFWDKVRMSSVAYLCLCLIAAALAAGPWVRARRSLSVRAA